MTSALTWDSRTSALQVAEYFKDQLKGRVVLLTGPSKDGIGLATALALASQGPATIIFVGRSITNLEASKAEVIKDFPDIHIRLVQCDLSNIDSVKKAAETINAYPENIDIVINNAAVMDTPYELTKDGFELQLESNYLGHFILVESILPKVLKGVNKRIIMVSSMGHGYGGINWEDPNFLKGGYTPNLGYGQSKTACSLYAINLTTRFGPEGLTAFALHPGGIETLYKRYDSDTILEIPAQIANTNQHWTLDHKMEMNKKYGQIYDDEGKAIHSEKGPWKTPDQGSSTTLRAALDPTLASHSGAYLDDCEIANSAPWASNEDDAARLLGWSNKLVGTNFH